MSIGQLAQNIVHVFMIAAWIGTLASLAIFLIRRYLHIPPSILDGGLILLFLVSIGLLHRV